MNTVQRLIKSGAIALAVFLIINIFGGLLFVVSLITNIDFGGGRSRQNFEEVYENVKSVELELPYSDVILKVGDEFKVKGEQVSKSFRSTLEDGTLEIKENKNWLQNQSPGTVTILIPEGIYLEELSMDSGAGRIVIDGIVSDNLELDQGAGIVEIKNSFFEQVSIDGGAGEIQVRSSTLKDLDIDAGIGRVDLEAEILGNSQINCGVGEMKIFLLGHEKDYRLSISKGIGNIQLNGVSKESNFIHGDGINQLRLDGGIGNIEVSFEEVDS